MSNKLINFYEKQAKLEAKSTMNAIFTIFFLARVLIKPILKLRNVMIFSKKHSSIAISCHLKIIF